MHIQINEMHGTTNSFTEVFHIFDYLTATVSFLSDVYFGKFLSFAVESRKGEAKQAMNA